MNHKEIAIMLTFASTIDGRLQPDQATVLAWAEVLKPDIDHKWAAEYVKKHYGLMDAMLVPSALNRAWGERKRLTHEARITPTNVDSHCGRSGCGCEHRVCYRGWIDLNDRTGPCSNCRADLAELIAHMPPPGSRNAADQSAIQNRYKA